MQRSIAAPYNTGMEAIRSSDSAAEAPFLHGLVDRDYQQLVDALEPDATMRALLPGGLREWAGAAMIGAAFERWFGDATSYEVADATIGRIGDLHALRWRLRLRAERFGDAVMVVEQQAYAAPGPTGRIAHISLLCSGFRAQQRNTEGRA